MSIFLVVVYYVSRFINAILVTNFIRHERSECLNVNLNIKFETDKRQLTSDNQLT
jgi:hypothetical protein